MGTDHCAFVGYDRLTLEEFRGTSPTMPQPWPQPPSLQPYPQQSVPDTALAAVSQRTVC